MGGGQGFGVPSTARFLGHPVHPMLVPFPIALLTSALASDIAALFSGDPFWGRASFWLIAGGLVSGTLAAVAGLTDFLTIRPVRTLSTARHHLVGNAAAMILSAANLWVRWDDPSGIWPWGLLLSATVAMLLGATGWLGGELVFRHGVGVAAPHPSAVVAAGTARPDLRRSRGVRSG